MQDLTPKPIDYRSRNQDDLNKSNSNKFSHYHDHMPTFQLSFKRRKHLVYGKNYIPEEETIRNDYSLHYVLTGSRPQNQLHNTALSTRFAEYPKLKKLLQLKKSQVSKYSHPPMYIQADLRPMPYPNSFNLLDLLPSRFDVIVLDPPLEEYIQRYPHLTKTTPSILKSGGALHQERAFWNWDELENLPIPSIAASTGFIFLWCGSGQGSTLEWGRSLLSKWGYRKCEDLVWVKTNHHPIQNYDQLDQNLPPSSTSLPFDHSHEAHPISTVFASTKEHCLMGIRGTVRRSTDGHFVHCNVDTDVIVSEPDPNDVLHKPQELYQLIENFCLGKRRLDLFGSRKTLRPGWLTIGNECEPNSPNSTQSPQNQVPIPYEKSSYSNFFLDHSGRTHYLLPTDTEIDNLRPRSPPMRIVPGTALTGVASPHGRGYLPRSIPIAGPDGNMIRNTIGGRNTVSHPSGGLGRGPGNALLPGMRVSGSRDSNQNRIINQMGYYPTSVNLSSTCHNPNISFPQSSLSSYPFIQPPHPLYLTAWSQQTVRLRHPTTTHPTHQHLSTTSHTSYPTSSQPIAPHPPFYHRTFPPDPGHTTHPYYTQILSNVHDREHSAPHVAHLNRPQFVIQHSFPLPRHLHTRLPRQLHTHRDDPFQSPLSNTRLNTNVISDTSSLSVSQLHP